MQQQQNTPRLHQPLTAAQRTTLRNDMLLAFLIGGILLGCAGIALALARSAATTGPHPAWLALAISLGLAVFTLRSAWQSLIDLQAGHSTVQQATLIERFPSRRSLTTCRFAEIGDLTFHYQVGADLLPTTTVGRRYRICYSPASRRLWSLH